MAQLRDELVLEVSQTLTALDQVDKALDKIWRSRGKLPSPVPSLPTGSGSGSGSGRTPAETQMDRISNRLKVVQQEMNRLGDGASQQQLDAYATRLARLTTQANALAPGLDQSSRAGARLSGILTGLSGTTDRVRTALDQMSQGPRLAGDPESLRRLREQIKDIGNQITTVRAQFISGTGPATQAEVVALTTKMAALKNQAQLLAQGLPAGSKELRQLSLAAAQAERTIAGANGQMSRLGLASQVKLGVGGALDEFRAFQGPVNGLAQMAKFSDAARVSSLLFESQLRRQNITMDEGAKVVNRLVERLKIMPSQAQESIQVLLRNGFNLEQAYTVLERAGASAIARGRSSADGVQIFADAIQSQNSAFLNSIGIAGNLSDFYYQYGKTIDVSANKLDKYQKAQAATNLVIAETEEELANLPTLQAGLGGGFSDLSIEAQRFQIAFGKAFIGPLAQLVRGFTGALDVFNQLPTPLKDISAKLLIVGGSAFFLVKGLLLVRANVMGVNAQLFGTAAAGTAGAGGMAVYNAQLVFLKQNAATALAQVGALKAGLNILGAAAIGVTIGLQINAVDLGEGKGTIGENIQLAFLNQAKTNDLDGKIMRAILGISKETAEEASTQLANDLSGITKKAEEKYATALAQGGEKYAGLLRIRDNAIQSNARIVEKRKTTTDPQELANLQRQVDMNNRVIASMNAQAAAILKAKAAKSGDVKSTQDQDEAYASLQASLRELGQQFGETKTTEFQRQLEQARKGFEKFEKDIAKAVKKGEITAAQGKLLTSALDTAEGRVVPDLVTRQVEENKRTALQGQREIQDGQNALIKEGRKRREAELTLETTRLKDEYARRIAEAQQNADASGLNPTQRKALNDEVVRLEGERDDKIELARRKANDDLEELERERHKRVLDAEIAASQTQVQVAEAGLAALVQSRNAALNRADGNAGRLAAERRYGDQIVEQQREIAEASSRIKTSQLAQDYAEEMRASRESGNQRGALELAAREKYGAALRALEIETRTQVSDAVIGQKERENEAVARLEQRGLDRVLANIGKATGAELTSIKARLEARRALALADGNAPLADALDKAIEGVTGQMVENARDFRDRLSESRVQATDLRTQLAEIAQTPLEAARKSAAGPFDTVIKGAQKQLTDLRKAYGKVATPTTEDTADFTRRQGELTDLVTRATAQRTQAQTAAETRYYRERADKAQSAHLSLSKRELDLGRLTLDGYERVLAADGVYWEARRHNAAEGSEEQEAAAQHLRENEDELLRLAGERRAYEKEAASFSREELQSGLELAASDRDRARSLELLNTSDRQRVADLSSEIASLAAQGGHERQILDLRRERAVLQKDLATRQREELEHARALTQSVLDRVDAESKLAEKVARSDAAAAQARQRGIENAYGRLSALDGQVSNVKSEEEYNKLLAERANLLSQIHDLEVAAALAPLSIEQERFGLQAAQRQLRTTLLGLSQEETVQAQEGLRLAQEAEDIARQRLAVMRQEGNPSEQRQAETEAIRAQVAVLEARNRLIQAPITQERTRLQLLQAQGAASLALMGLGEDEQAQAQLKLETAQRELVVANAALSVASGRAQVEEALTGQANARVALVSAETAVLQANVSAQKASASSQKEVLGQLESLRSAQREYARAQIKAAQDLLGATQKQRDVEAVIGDLADDEVASAERALSASQERLELTRSLLQSSSGASPEDRAGLLSQQIELLGEVAEGERQVEAAQRARRTVLEDLTVAQSGLRAEMAGGSAEARSLVSAQDALAAARLRVAQAEREYADAVARGNPGAVKSATEGLTSALAGQRSAIQKISDAYQDVINKMKSVQDAGASLRKAVDGEGEGARINPNLELDRFYAIERRRQTAIAGLQDALRSGDVAAIATATRTLAEQEERYKKQAELLGKNGVTVNLRDEPTVRSLADQVDRLGIEGDREVDRIQQRADAAKAEAEATVTFVGGVQLFGQKVDDLLGGLKGAAESSLSPEERARRQAARDELAQATAGLKGAVKQSLAEAGNQYSKAVREATGGSTDPRIAPRSEAQQQALETQLAQRYGAGLVEAVRVATQEALRPYQAPTTTPPPAQKVDNSKHVTVNHSWGGINITTQPGQDARALYDDIMAEAQRRGDLIGTGDC
ncbi:hypothetical protein [Deinococcus sp. Leaf326]|uniref:hypothetical protein n=1 Tax=Deinococcus sp. Leaf326 TaxID=1736338 RepID=UPI0006FADBAB|nr:hypothetical protein [Deinococcus sp. Leaf326]KQR37726.1 hypothetical protein ASF71_14695 [Deinococcus sp. Leaf326]